jgi:hypothetical protein
MPKREWFIHFLLGALVAGGFGFALPWFSWNGSLLGLPLSSIPSLIIGVFAYGLIGVVTVGWLIIPAVMVTYANVPALAVFLRQKHALLWFFPLHYVLGVLLAMFLVALGLRLPAT